MHDPDVVAFQIRRPWPKHSKACTIDGRVLPAYRFWPALVTVWHREPGGRDAGEVCKHYRRSGDQVTVLRGWRCHVHHWRIQVPPLQALRRRLLTRCIWCGGRSTKADPVDHSLSWDGSRGRWWRGEPGLHHGDCAGISRAHATCVCASPIFEYDGYGRCSRCGRSRSFGMSDETLARARTLAVIPAGARRAPAREATWGRR